jgi:translation initiation factor 1
MQSMKVKKRISTGKETSPGVAPVVERKETGSPVPAKDRGRVDIIRQTAHRGGKTVTVVKGFVGVGPVELKELGRALQKACGAGGTVKDGCVEIQGDHRDVVAGILKASGFRPVLAGG